MEKIHQKTNINDAQYEIKPSAFERLVRIIIREKATNVNTDSLVVNVDQSGGKLNMDSLVYSSVVTRKIEKLINK